MGFFSIQKIKDLIKTFKPHIIHTHASKAGAIGRWAGYNTCVPIIIHTFHGHVFDAYFNNLKSNFYVLLEKELAKKTDILIALSQNQKIDLTENYKIATDEKVKVIPLGLDLKKYTFDKETKRKKVRQEFNILDDIFVFSLVGRIAPIKNHKLAIDAAKIAIKESNKPIKFYL